MNHSSSPSQRGTEEDRHDAADRIRRSTQGGASAFSPRGADAQKRRPELHRDPFATAHQAGVTVHDLFTRLTSRICVPSVLLAERSNQSNQTCQLVKVRSRTCNILLDPERVKTLT